jgi:hypothetical protein
MRPKQSVLSASDLQELAERLALMLNHAGAFPVSGVTVIDGFLILAIKIPGHSLDYDRVARVLFLDGKDVTRWAELQSQSS